MRYYIPVLTAILMLTACGGEQIPGGTSSSSSSSSSSGNSSSGGSAQYTPSEQAFELTLYPILQENCSVCHNSKGAQQEPMHSDANLATAHAAAITVADLNNPANSRFISRLRDDKHMCWGNCDTAAAEVQQAIEDWQALINGGPITEVACDAKFPQDLILLGELPFVKSMQALFGEDVAFGKLAPDAATKLFSQKGTVANTSLINTRLDWATHVTTKVQRRASQLSGCLTADRNCARSYIEKLAHRAFRRPVSGTEIDDLMTVYDLGAQTNFSNGIKLAAQAILVSPSFNHRSEYGVQNSDGEFELTNHEFASTLSFLLTDALPDEELLQAADSGALSDPAERVRQTSRLLAMSSTKDSVESTLLSAWNFGNLFGKVKDDATYPEFNPGLASDMYEETLLFLRKNLWQGGVSNVLSSRTTFVNGPLADLYGIPFPGNNRDEFVEVTIDDGKRAGILTQASFLTAFSRTDQTSVVARGLFVNGPLLCLPKIAAPPDDVIDIIEEQLNSDATEVELAEFRANTVPCKNCHNQFDAYGLLFESYDAIGQYREFDEKGAAIHAGVDLSKMASFDGYVGGAVDFADLLTDRPDFVQCVTRHMFAYATGNDEVKRNQCEVTNITDQLNNQSTLGDIIKAVVQSPALSTRIAETN